MPEWKDKLIELVPEEREEWLIEDSIYLAFSWLLDTLGEAVRSENWDLVKRCFEFAQWCFGQEEKDLWNSAGVSFYEHLADDPTVERVVHRFVKRETFEDVRGLLEFMDQHKAAERISNRYKETGE